MDNFKPMQVETAWGRLRDLADELAATHAPPFTASFFEEHRAAIERAFLRLVDGEGNS